MQVLLEEAERRGGKEGLQAFLDATEAELERTALHFAVRDGSEETVKASGWAWVQHRQPVLRRCRCCWPAAFVSANELEAVIPAPARRCCCVPGPPAISRTSRATLR